MKLALYAPGAHPGVAFAGLIGQTYGIQTTTNLAGANSWQGLTNLTLTGLTNLWLDSQPATQRQKFYRVVSGAVSVP